MENIQTDFQRVWTPTEVLALVPTERTPAGNRIATFVPDIGLSFNQILVLADEPTLFHLGMRALFPAVSEAVATVLPLDQLRWLDASIEVEQQFHYSSVPRTPQRCLDHSPPSNRPPWH
ncbi:MAG TPA: hypothetical protein VMM60_02175 [Ilumatobacter sp.]|nr:hypothetical protein [Ilumatobacter sp.]